MSFDERSQFVGHTSKLGVNTPRFGGSVTITDTGIAEAQSQLTSGKRLEVRIARRWVPPPLLPVDEEGIIPYFPKMQELETEYQRLTDWIERLLNPRVEETAEELNIDPVNEIIE